jgi:hypothetical protein
LWTAANSRDARSAAASRLDACARAAAAPSSSLPGGAPSMPIRTRRDVVPFFSWSSSTACSGVGAEGKNAERSAM